MPVADFVLVLNAVTAFIGAVIWPVVVFVVVWKVLPTIRGLLERANEVNVKVPGGFEAAIKRQAEVAGLVAAAAVTSTDASPDPEERARRARDAARTTADLAHEIAGNTKGNVLWVDDRPANNVYERSALEALGIQIDLATSTDEAFAKLVAARYDLLITDMGRPPDPRAGYTLLDRLRASGNNIPVVIYAGSSSAEHREEARKHGALGTTSRPDELVQLVVRGISRPN